MTHVKNNSGNVEWYTPSYIIEMARSVMGGIDLDPASSEEANKVVKATTYFDVDDDGLTMPWRGRVWMNPPYARGTMDLFANKAKDEIGNIFQMITLVNNATETKWFSTLASFNHTICFPRKRIRYVNPNGVSKSPLQGQAIFYHGLNQKGFVETFSEIGNCFRIMR